MAMQNDVSQKLKKLPAVGIVIEWNELKESIQREGRAVVLNAVKMVLAEIREAIQRGRRANVERAALIKLVEEKLLHMAEANLRIVINATGVLVHTNLGRAPLARSAASAVYEIARNYSTLEYDLNEGKRGSRHDLISDLLKQITQADGAMAVNNNAAAVLLTLNTLAEGRDVIVSRGELVEIGGSFRIPDVIRKSGCRMVEVGTTNKTHLADYRNAMTSDAAVLLKVHRSNFRVEGFVAEVSIEQLVALGREKNIPVMFDLGSGCLLKDGALWAIDEPTVSEVLEKKCSILSFSGDKLLGGPQAGIIVGDRDIVEACKKNPLTRAFRLDKMTLAALEATLRLYRDPVVAAREIPVLRAALTPADRLREQADKMAARLAKDLKDLADFDVAETRARIGGGAMPLHDVPSYAVTVKPARMSSRELERKLRLGKPAVIARLADDRVWIDFRSLLDGQQSIMEDNLAKALAAES